jgi:hypothetical protein
MILLIHEIKIRLILTFKIIEINKINSKSQNGQIDIIAVFKMLRVVQSSNKKNNLITGRLQDKNVLSFFDLLVFDQLFTIAIIFKTDLYATNRILLINLLNTKLLVIIIKFQKFNKCEVY